MAGRAVNFIVYSSLYGNYDQPKPPRPHPRVAEWRLYTDTPNIYAPGWRVVVERNSVVTPRMQAKYRKCNLPEDADTSLYLDASVRLFNPKLIDECVEKLESGSVWCAYPHPERNTLRAELEASDSCTWKYRHEIDSMRAQVADYEKMYQRIEKLWAGGVLARRHTPDAVAAGVFWWRECLRWSCQDQLSLPIALQLCEITPTALTSGGGLWGNENFNVERHCGDPNE